MSPRLTLLPLLALVASVLALPAAADAPKSEIPEQFIPVQSSFDYVRRQVMIPMRDGVKLDTVLYIPKGVTHAPILLTRTPYGAEDRFGAEKAHVEALIGSGDVGDELVGEDGYIRVIEDIRGKYGSEGDYLMNRPLKGPLNGSEVDHSTDTWDTIDWLVKNVPESNGRVGIIGISYDGFTALMALFHPHPALKAAVPINAMVDGWMGDDWFHKGAFRTDSLDYYYMQETSRRSEHEWWSDRYDSYDALLAAGSIGALAESRGLGQTGFWPKVAAHPAYDSFWQDQAIDKLLAKEPPVSVPTMLVHSLWDQEDIYGNIAVWKAVKPRDTASNVHLVIGPWFHHQQRLDGSAIGAIRFGSDTAQYFRREILRPFLDRYLKEGESATTTPAVTAYETGTNRWERLDAWPQGCPTGCRIETTPIYLAPAGRLGFEKPATANPGYESYVSDPAKPVPFLPRPIHLAGEAGEERWQSWLLSDQRDAASRPDVLSFATEPLRESVKIAGEPVATIMASTSGTDGDFVVKLIDVYPDQMGRQPELGGYQLMVSADILRGRYRESFSNPKPIDAGEKLPYTIALPTVNHVFLPGHRIMVQVQSSWFPLYDMNPQTYVDNIFFAKPADYRKAEIHVFDDGGSFVELPAVKGGKP
ncbi:MAG TPA: CocE/NonD family hydrolase [Stellaceae bacterium]|nr:CocE/NonD family hydrolase [Stellaceae bacterium]